MITKRKVLCEALSQAIEPYREAILDNFDDVYHVSEEDKLADKEVKYTLSEILQFASDVAFELEQENEN